MTEASPTLRVLRNLLQYGDLSFRDFVEIALYHPEVGYYMRPLSPVGKQGDYVTSPSLSPVFSYAIGRLRDEFVARAGGAMCTLVDIGCGAGPVLKDAIGIDRRLGNSLLDVPRQGMHLFFSNELFDALPFARLVKRGHELHELWVDANLEWVEHEAPEVYEDYCASHGIELEDGQFADVSLDWRNLYREIASS